MTGTEPKLTAIECPNCHRRTDARDDTDPLCGDIVALWEVTRGVTYPIRGYDEASGEVWTEDESGSDESDGEWTPSLDKEGRQTVVCNDCYAEWSVGPGASSVYVGDTAGGRAAQCTCGHDHMKYDMEAKVYRFRRACSDRIWQGGENVVETCSLGHEHTRYAAKPDLPCSCVQYTPVEDRRANPTVFE